MNREITPRKQPDRRAKSEKRVDPKKALFEMYSLQVSAQNERKRRRDQSAERILIDITVRFINLLNTFFIDGIFLTG